MSLIHWLTGVGNRQLDNTLVDVKTGCCIGISFGMVFGSGLERPIPELVPFRLTAQILDLLRPFTEKDLFGFTMTHALSAMRAEKQLFLSCVKVIINEPIDWYQKLNEQLKRENLEYKGIYNSFFYIFYNALLYIVIIIMIGLKKKVKVFEKFILFYFILIK